MNKKFGHEVEKSKTQSVNFISPVNTAALSHRMPYFRRVWQCSLFRADAGCLSYYGCRDRVTIKWTARTIVLHCTACIALYCTVLHCTALYCIVLHCTALYCAVMHCTALYCTVLHCTALYCTVLHCTTLYCIVLHCTALYCTVLHCTTLYCTVLHCTPAMEPNSC